MREQTDGNRQQRRHRRVSVLIMCVISGIIVALFLILYNGAKQSLLNIWENNVIQLAKSTEFYLARPADAIEFSAAKVETMLAEGKSTAEVGDYLVRGMENVVSLVENNYTGVYGYCRGVYLDASGWIPPAGYEPTQRPWYLAARAGGGQIALVSPFLNLQTNDMMMSVSKLLSDGESVLSIDIYVGTASCGAAEGASFEALYQRADQRMYEDKRSKRRDAALSENAKNPAEPNPEPQGF